MEKSKGAFVTESELYQQYLNETKQAPAQAAKPSDADLYQQYLSETKNQPQEQKTSAPESFIQHFGNAATFGYLPQIQAAVEPAIQAVADKFLPSDPQGFQVQQAPAQDYIQRRDQYIQDQNTMSQEHPTASLLGTIGGAISGGVATGGAIAKGVGAGVGLVAPEMGAQIANGVRAGTIGQRLRNAAAIGGAIGAVRNPGDTQGEISPLQLEDRAKNTATDAALGGVIQGGGEVLGKVGSAIKDASGTLKNYSQLKALKASGAMLKDFRKAFGNSRANELGQAAIDEGLIGVGDDIHAIAQKAKSAQSEVGNNISKIYDSADEIAAPAIANNPKTKMSQMIDQELSNMKADIAQSQAGKRSSSSVLNAEDGQGYLKKINTSSDSTFPEWNGGASKQETLDALERKSGKVYDRLVEKAKENLRRGYESTHSGPIPPNPEFVALEKGGDIAENLKQAYADELNNPLYSDSERSAIQNELNQKIANNTGPNIDLEFKKITEDFSKNIAEKYKGKAGGSEIVNKIQNVLDDISSNEQVSFSKAKEIRSSIDDLINYNKANNEMTSVQSELKNLRNSIQDKVKENLAKIDDHAGTDFLSQFTKENKRYSNLAELSKIATDKSARMNSNSAFGLREQIGGGAGGAIGATIGGPVGAAIGSVSGAAIAKVSKNYGTPFVALTANKIAQALERNPEALGTFSGPLIKAAQNSSKDFVSSIGILMKEPEFKQAVESIKLKDVASQRPPLKREPSNKFTRSNQ